MSGHRWDDNARPRAARFPSRVALGVVARDPECRLQLPGCTGDSEEADHIVGWPEAEALGWTVEQFNDPEANGQGACAHCHSIKTQGQAASGRARARARRPRARPARKHPGLK